ncbi:MAG TPA: Flp family type IVb pilin [Terracidiphilus sp.]|jgi:pilus assembly protein Flp/PilA|nr:Flp family type IVb pilin [Terracidiphilus sp.]
MNNLLQYVYLKVQEQINDEEGQDLVEYALMIVLVAIASVAGVNSVASAINTVFSNISATLS